MTRNIGLSKPTRIARILEREIKTGTIARGDRIESETALMQRFSVSRNTVRKGLEILSGDGLITTRSGIGSFVTYGGSIIDSEAGWSLALSEGELQIGTRILHLSRAEMALAGKPVAVGTDCLCVDRLRFRQDNGRGISLERSRLPWRDGFAELPQSGLINGSLSESLAAAGLVTGSGEEWANVLPALSAQDAAIMGREPGEPMLRLRRLTRAADGSIIEFVESILAPNHFGLHLEF